MFSDIPVCRDRTHRNRWFLLGEREYCNHNGENVLVDNMTAILANRYRLDAEKKDEQKQKTMRAEML